MKHFILFILGVTLFAVSGCGDNQQSSHPEHEAPAIAVTLWTDTMELFMEYEIASVNQPVKFIVHLTTLADFKPIPGGDLTLQFAPATGKAIEVKTDKILREGIFTPVYKFDTAGNYKFTLHYKGANIEASFDVGDFSVYRDRHAIPPRHEEGGDEGISYLKEQQWKTDFRSEPLQKMAIHSSIITLGDIMPRQQSYVELASPVDGVVDVVSNQKMVHPGAEIKKGTRIVVLRPPLDAANSWVEWYLEFERVKKEYERAENLYQKNSISIDKYEEIKYAYLIQKAKYGAILSGSGDEHVRFSLAENTLEIKSPISGIVSQIDVQLGQKVTAGQRLMTLVDPTKIWLKLNLFEKDFYSIDSLHGAAIVIPGKEGLLTYDKNALTLLNKGGMIDPDTRTIPVRVELGNPAGLLKIGQVVQVELYTSAHTEQLCAPQSAIFDDEGKSILFVHTAGESFEKRDIVTGGSNNGWIAILKGVKAGERVVTVGGYQVKLASTSAEIGHPHAH